MENIVGNTLSEETNTKNIEDITMVEHHNQTPMLYNRDCLPTTLFLCHGKQSWGMHCTKHVRVYVSAHKGY
jgi:hypothetical protein